MEGEKRKRSKNYSEEEKEKVLSLVGTLKNVIENKKTDAVSSNLKIRAWADLALLYNATAKTGERSGQQLKLLYDSLKKTAKRHKADDKIEIYKTEEESISSTLTTCDTKVSSILLGSQTEEHNNAYDSNEEGIINEHVFLKEDNVNQITMQDQPSTSRAPEKCKIKCCSNYCEEIFLMKKERHEKKMEILEIIKQKEMLALEQLKKLN